MTRIPSFRAD